MTWSMLREVLDQLIGVIDNEKISLVLEECDIFLSDNFRGFHRREPWEGDQQTLVFMWAITVSIAAYQEIQYFGASASKTI